MHLFVTLIVLVFVSCAHAAETSPVDPASQDVPKVQVVKHRFIRDVPYVPGGGPRQQLDLLLPDGVEKPPLLVWIHGGGWRQGDKFPVPLRDRMLNQGYALAAINYRFTAEAIFPAQLIDCKSAIRWLRAHADEYGYDPERIGVWGSSAGGHLVAMLGTTGTTRQFDVGEHLDQSSEVQAVVDICGPTDFGLAHREPERFGEPNTRKMLLGDFPNEMTQRAAAASPITYVSDKSAPFLIIHGDVDKRVEKEHAILFKAALDKAGAKSELVILPEVGHTGILPRPDVADKIEVFLRGNLNRRGTDSAEAPKPNVLFIIMEDTNWQAFGCYGNPICKTPNFDKLASTGIMFEHAYCQGSACNASRASFATGMRPRTTRILTNSHRICDEVPDIVGMPELFKEAGYATIDIGKFYHDGATFAPKQMMGFTRIEHGPRPEGWNGPKPIMPLRMVKPDLTKRAKTQIKREPADEMEKRRFASDSYGDSGLDQQDEPDWQFAKIACMVLEEMAVSKEPFFLVLSQSKPHAPFLAPTKFCEMYAPENMPDQKAPISALKNFPYIHRSTGPSLDIFRETPSTPVTAKAALAAYYACISCVDDNIGMTLETLEKTGLDKNTIVVLIGDHGVHLGDHNMWSKVSMLEGTQRSPLIVRVPNVKENGKVCREIVEYVDLLPTLAELCGLRKIDQLEGISFAPLLEKIDTPWKTAAFLVDQDNGQVVRTKQYSYMEFGDPKRASNYQAALYDLVKDPHETVNVVDEPAYAKVKQQMAEMLQQGWPAALAR